MQAILYGLAVLGVLALLRALGRTLLRFGLGAAEETAAAGMADLSARRGDITGLAERTEAAREARRQRWRDGLFVLFWLGWLILPPILGLLPEVYAVAAGLWLLAPPRVLRPRPGEH